VISVTHDAYLPRFTNYLRVPILTAYGPQSPAVQGFQRHPRAAGVIALGCDDARKFIRFLAFGLTLCARRPTVTVRNHYYQQPPGQGAKRHAI
jgi:hypothetical protein